MMCPLSIGTNFGSHAPDMSELLSGKGGMIPRSSNISTNITVDYNALLYKKVRE